MVRPPALASCRAAGAITTLLAGMLLATSVGADARSDYLMRLLRSSSQFRVRVQAAISLGRAEGRDGDVVRVLSQALGDGHPAVRAAAATALGRLENPRALGALRNARKDGEKAVRAAVRTAIARLERVAARGGRGSRGTHASPTPSGSPRYYVRVARPGSKVKGLSAQTLERARAYVEQRIAQIPGVEVAEGNPSRAQVERTLKGRKLRGFHLDSAVVSMQERPDGSMRIGVSVIVGTYPGRDMRAILQGAATVQGNGGRGQIVQALEGALRGALRRLPQALKAGRR